MIVPFGPINKNFTLSREEKKTLFTKLPGLLIRNTGGFENTLSKGFYAIISDKHKEIDELSSYNTRRNIRLSLRENTVRRIDPEYLAANGYETYLNAIKRYSNYKAQIVTQKVFAAGLMATSGYDDIIHYWGVFHKGKLCGYAQNYIFGKTEASYSSSKYDPDYLNKKISVALLHTTNEYYLKENNFSYVSDGFMSLLHDTKIQDFLIERFEFKKQYLPLQIEYKKSIRLAVGALYPFRKTAGKLDDRLASVLTQEEVRRSQLL
jgi:hypothetical protein